MWRPDKTEWARQRSKWFDEHFADVGIRQKSYEAGANALAKSFAAWLRNETTKHDSSFADLIYLILANILEGENDGK